MKKLLVALAITFSVPALALDFLVPTKPGGMFHKTSTLISNALPDMNIKVNLAGNCVLGKTIWEETKTNTIYLNSEVLNNREDCHIDVTESNLRAVIATGGFAIVSRGDTVGKTIGVVGYMEHTARGLGAKAIPYANSTEVVNALKIGEIDSGLVPTAKMNQVEGTKVLMTTLDADKGEYANWPYNGMVMNFYILATPDVSEETMNTIVNTPELVEFVNSVNMPPVQYGDIPTTAKSLVEIEKLWKK